MDRGNNVILGLSLCDRRRKLRNMLYLFSDILQGLPQAFVSFSIFVLQADLMGTDLSSKLRPTHINVPKILRRVPAFDSKYISNNKLPLSVPMNTVICRKLRGVFKWFSSHVNGFVENYHVKDITTMVGKRVPVRIRVSVITLKT